MKKISTIASLLLLAAVATTGCKETDTRYEYIVFDMANISFAGDGGVPVTVKVTATGEWDAESSASWLAVTDKTSGSITVAADKNDSESEREAKITFTMGDVVEEVPVNQLGVTGSEYVYRYPGHLDLGLVMSPDGRYVGGVEQALQEDESFNYQIWVFDLERDESYMVAEIPNAIYGFQEPRCITNDGVVFVRDYHSGGTIGVDLDGNFIVPDGVEGFAGAPNVQGTSAEGRVWVGWQRDGTGFDGRYYPVKWVDGVPEVLPTPDKNAHGKPFVDDILGGVMAYGCSHDGSVIYGSSKDNSEYSACYWKNGEFHWAAEKDRDLQMVETMNSMDELITVPQLSGPKIEEEATNISPDGRWLAVTWCREQYTLNSYQEIECPAFIDLETDKAYLFEELSGGARHVTDNGLGFTIDGFLANSGRVVDVNDKVVIGDMHDWIADNYGIVAGPGSIVYVSPDMRKLLSLYYAPSVMTGFRTTHWFIAPGVGM